MAKVYLEATDSAFTVNNNTTTVYGASGDQTVTVILGITGLTTDQNIERVIFSKTSSDYTYKQSGNQIQIYLNDSLVIIIPVQGDSDGTELIFANGSANALLTNGVMTIGKASSYTPIDATTGSFDSKLVIPTPTPTPDPTPTLDPTPPAPPSDTTAPTLTSSTPADNATAIAINSNIALTFSENITAVTGKNITIKKTSDDSIITTIDAADAQITIVANVATINPTADLATDTEYYLLIDSGAFKDSSNNVYTGISSTTALSFTTTDTVAPTLTSSTPADNATAVAVGANIVLTMSENITAVTGKNIVIKKTSDSSITTTIDAADPQVTIAANVVTINPTSDLATDTEYYLLVDSGAFKDSSNNDYAGISSTMALSFTTVDTVVPTLTSSTPTDNATAVAPSANIALTFSENITAVTGKNITIKKTSDDSTITTIDAADAQITIAANVATINPTSDLGSSTEYYVLVDSGAFKDSSNNLYTGISSTTALSFTTADTIAPTLTSSTPVDNATAIAVGTNIVLTMSEAVTAVTGKNITIKKTSDDSTITTIDAADAQVSIAANVVTINPTADLGFGIEYYVLVDTGAFKDSSNNLYAGISSAVDFSFTTAADPVVYLATIAAGIGGFAINGEVGDYSGYSVSSAGDLNGDGLSDLIVGAYFSSAAAAEAGRSYVVFGKSDGAIVSLSTIASGTGGFAINGQTASDYSGYSVSSAGDVNGDGLSDLIVGAFQNDIGGANTGRSYVVFGKSDGATVSLTTIAAGTGGFAINGQAASDLSGNSVSSAGDVNGDGLSDLIVGAPYNDTGAADAGRSYIIFGKTNTATVSLTTIAAGTGGFAINGQAASDLSGYSVSSAGDVNGDGLADLIVGARNNDIGATDAGRSYVVFGKSDGAVVSLATIAAGTGGFAINGEAAYDYSGLSVSSAGDVNGDGLADLIVGAYGNDTGASSAGRSYVVFGKSDGATVSLATIASGTGGFAINGQAVFNDRSGYSVSSAGDVNGDGLADLIVGAHWNDATATDAGRSYIVFGKSDGAVVSLTTIAAGTGGFAINGQTAYDYSGYSVSSAGDVNGDGLADLIIGAHGNSSNAGRSYVIFGGTQWLTTSVTGTGSVMGTTAAEVLIGSSSSDTITGGGGIDRFYAGDSNDVIVLVSSDITNLQDNTTGSPKAAINGGGDMDTIRLTAGANLNLALIANQGASGVEENSRIESIEKIDMSTDTATNILTLTVNDVIDMSGMNLFNTSNGWTNGTYTLGASVFKHQIAVDGTAADSLVINAGNGVWANGGNVTNGAATYDVYNNALSNAQVLVLSGVAVTNNDA